MNALARRCAGAFLALALATTGCSAGDRDERQIVVFGAASLTDAFADLANEFEKANQVTVVLQFAGSQTLVRQLVEGAPADVFASANEVTMTQAVDGGAVTSEPQIFASNTMTLVAPAGNPAGIRGLDDLADEDLVIALCAVEVPCGSVSQAVLDTAGVSPRPDTFESSVRATLTKITLGEADAALVYRTDALAAADAITVIDPPADDTAALQSVRQLYPIAVIANAADGQRPVDYGADDATAFVDFVLSARGQTILARHGFTP